jgi:hypothetical protein
MTLSPYVHEEKQKTSMKKTVQKYFLFFLSCAPVGKLFQRWCFARLKIGCLPRFEICGYEINYLMDDKVYINNSDTSAFSLFSKEYAYFTQFLYLQAGLIPATLAGFSIKNFVYKGIKPA